MSIKVNALLLADSIYQDISSGKFILSGIFYQVNVPNTPFIRQNSMGVFVSLLTSKSDFHVQLKIINPDQKTVLIETNELNLINHDEETPILFGIEFPPFTIYNLGKHTLCLEVDGVSCLETPLHIYKI